MNGWTTNENAPAESVQQDERLEYKRISKVLFRIVTAGSALV